MIHAFNSPPSAQCIRLPRPMPAEVRTCRQSMANRATTRPKLEQLIVRVLLFPCLLMSPCAGSSAHRLRVRCGWSSWYSYTRFCRRISHVSRSVRSSESSSFGRRLHVSPSFFPLLPSDASHLLAVILTSFRAWRAQFPSVAEFSSWAGGALFLEGGSGSPACVIHLLGEPPTKRCGSCRSYGSAVAVLMEARTELVGASFTSCLRGYLGLGATTTFSRSFSPRALSFE